MGGKFILDYSSLKKISCANISPFSEYTKILLSAKISCPFFSWLFELIIETLSHTMNRLKFSLMMIIYSWSDIKNMFESSW